MASAFAARPPGGLFWKVFIACWCTAMLTGAGIGLLATLMPTVIALPPPPSGVTQSVGVPVLTGGLVALLISGVLAWSLSRPIRLLRQAFSDAASGALATRVAPRLGHRHDEFADLARDYDAMAQQLDALLGAQRRLLHDVSHELRSPLARLQLAVGLLHRSPAGLEQALSRIEREVQRLDALVGEVLTLARLESGTPLGTIHEIDALALLASVAEDARFEARAQGLELQLDAEAGEVIVRAHGELLARAFDNVIRNAVKYTPAGRKVDVTASVDPAAGALRIEVGDRGPGLPAETLQRIFEPFVRIASGPAQPGFGLGLAIARRAVQAHGGSLVASARAGGGLLVTFTLPALTRFNPEDGANPADATASGFEDDGHAALTPSVP